MKETKKDKWINYWNKRADESGGYLQGDYINLSSFENTKNTVLQMVEGLSGKIVDIGCGSGMYSVLFAKKKFAVYGVDFSLKMIHEAINRSKQEQVNAHFFGADGENLPFKSEKFDIVLLVHVLQSFESCERIHDKRIIEECYRILKYEGNIIIVALNKQSPLRIKLRIQNFLCKPFGGDNKQLYSISHLTKRLNEDGFKEIQALGIPLSPVMKPKAIKNIFEKVFKYKKIAASFVIKGTKRGFEEIVK